MSGRNMLSLAPPYEVEDVLKRLGGNLRTARLRRNLTIEEVAGRIGTGPRAVMNAERGMPTARMATYGALLWVYGLLSGMDGVADPEKDTHGIRLERMHGRVRARHRNGGRDRLDNDF